MQADEESQPRSLECKRFLSVEHLSQQSCNGSGRCGEPAGAFPVYRTDHVLSQVREQNVTTMQTVHEARYNIRETEENCH